MEGPPPAKRRRTRSRTPAARKKPKPIHAAVREHARGGAVSSLREARKLTSRFHTLLQEESAVSEDAELKSKEKEARLAEIRAEIKAMGGRKAYQDASIAATSAFRTSRFVFQSLTHLNARPASGEPLPRVLEVGAVNTQLLSCPWLDVRAIDLLSRDRRIEQKDFFDLDVNETYDIVVCSMVLNCVPTPLARGEMLVRCREHLRNGGFFFVMVPLRCLHASPFMTWARFQAAMEAAGFSLERHRNTPKVLLSCWRTADRPWRIALADIRGEARSAPEEERGTSVSWEDARRWFASPPPELVRTRGKGDTTQFAISFFPEKDHS